MKLKITLLAMSAWMLSLAAMAQGTYYNLPPLHVDGNQMKDEKGNIVVLHGVMDTPNTYFNGGRWQGSKAQGWWDDYNDTGAKNCITYFNKLFTAITDTNSGAYCNLFRLHLDPAWTNGNAGAWKVDSRETGDGEADISKYTGSKLTKWMKSLYFKIAQKGMSHGLYIIMRPPGVCPENIYVDGSYQKFLLDVWDRVTKNDSILKYSGQISIELANEPRGVKLANGSSSEKALHDFFQPIVDKIRENGFKGIIWVPGTGYQSWYTDYAKYPITGENIGYAVHNYAGWYGCSDDSYDTNNAIKQFGNQVPVIKTNPIVITEVDWSPQNKSGEIDHYNEFNQPVYKNYGTWATASTSKWGKAYKAILDYYGNISMTLTGTGDYIDIDDYINKKKVTPAFKTIMEKNKVDPYEACGVACFQWYEEYAKVNYPSAERYQPLQEVPERPFEMSKNWFQTSIIQENTATFTSFLSVKLKKDGLAGWSFEDCIDLSGYKYLVLNLKRNGTKDTYLRIYDHGSFFGDCYQLNLKGEKDFVIDLHDLKTEAGRVIDPSHIRLVGFAADAEATVYVGDAFLSNDGQTEETAIKEVKVSPVNVQRATDYYDLSGRRVQNPTKGFYIVKGKKVFVK